VKWWIASAVPASLLGLGWLFSFGPSGAQWASPAGWLVLLLLVVVAATDLSSRRIPNWATYTALAWGISAQVVLAVTGGYPSGNRLGFPHPGEAVAGFFLGFTVFFLLYGILGGGAGDVKLAAALGLFLGPAELFEVILITCLAAGLVGAIVVTKSVLLPGPADMPHWRQRVKVALAGKLPMAPFFSGWVVGALVFSLRRLVISCRLEIMG